MPVFISYSHQDKAFVNRLAAHLVKRNAHVWVDAWELNVGDSLIRRIQEAIETSDALLVVLSKASVESEWCKKELNAGLVRELEEKRVLVLPLLLEDCAVPLFLREKKYADFREDFKPAFEDLINALTTLTTPDQGRVEQEEDGTFTDWAIDWGDVDGDAFVGLVYVTASKSLPLTVLVQMHVICNAISTKRYQQYHNAISLNLAACTS